MEVSAKKILGIDTISKGNEKPWATILNFIQLNNITEELMIDFKDIEMASPWVTANFMKLIRMPNIHIRVYNAPDLADAVDKCCILNNYPVGRVENVKPVIPVTQSKEEKEIIEMSKQLQDYFEVNDGVATFNVYKRFDQIGVPKTVAFIDGAMRLFAKNSGIKNMVLYTKNAAIQSGVRRSVADLVESFGKNGINLEIVTEDKEAGNQIAMCQSTPKKEWTDAEKVEIIKAKTVEGKVGMLIKYKTGKGKDEFGRYGKGQVISNRIAIFNKIFQKGGEWFVQVTSFNSNTFYTVIHWSLEHDGEILSKPQSETVIIPVSEFGIYNDFVGSRYHFITPLQYKKENSTVLYYVHNSKVQEKKLTIPELAKEVFDEFRIKYDKPSLARYIEETEKIMQRND